MSGERRFCTECGAALAEGMKFCTQCGRPVAGAVPAQQSLQDSGRGERVLGIVPFLEQGLLSVVRYTLVVTDRRLIFRTWDPGNDEAMSDAEDEAMQESCSISETTDEIAHFRKKDWSGGPWTRYLTMPPDAIAAGAPGTIVIPIPEITEAGIVCETRTSTQDTLSILHGRDSVSFDLMYSQGPFLFGILAPLLGEKLTIEDHLHRRRGLDRLLSGEEYR